MKAKLMLTVNRERLELQKYIQLFKDRLFMGDVLINDADRIKKYY